MFFLSDKFLDFSMCLRGMYLEAYFIGELMNIDGVLSGHHLLSYKMAFLFNILSMGYKLEKV